MRDQDPGTGEPFFVDSVPAGMLWYHMYNTEIHPNTAFTFAQGRGDTRFAPIKDAAGAAADTYYVASEPDVAYMESVLHDAALSPPGVFEVATLAHYQLATIRLPKIEVAGCYCTSPIRTVRTTSLSNPRNDPGSIGSHI